MTFPWRQIFSKRLPPRLAFAFLYYNNASLMDFSSSKSQDLHYSHSEVSSSTEDSPRADVLALLLPSGAGSGALQVRDV